MSLVTKLVLIDEPDRPLRSAEIDLHDQLTDNADWNAPFWDFDPECLKTYAERLKRIFLESNRGIVFQALWVGDEPETTRDVSIDEFLEIVRNNRIGTKTKYVVRKTAP